MHVVVHHSLDIMLVSIVHLKLAAVINYFLISSMQNLLSSCYLKVPFSYIVLLSIDFLKLIIAHGIALVDILQTLPTELASCFLDLEVWLAHVVELLLSTCHRNVPSCSDCRHVLA
jgi:hypothetical protein